MKSTSKSGFALIEVLIAGTVMLGVFMVISTFIVMSSKSAKSIQESLDRTDFMGEVTSLLTVPNNCTASFGALGLKVKNGATWPMLDQQVSLYYTIPPVAPATVPTRVNPAAYSIVAPSNTYQQLTITSMSMTTAANTVSGVVGLQPGSEVNTYRGVFAITVKKSLGAQVGGQTYLSNLTINFSSDSAGNLLSCGLINTGVTGANACTAMNGNWDGTNNRCVFNDLQVSNTLADAHAGGTYLSTTGSYMGGYFQGLACDWLRQLADDRPESED